MDYTPNIDAQGMRRPYDRITVTNTGTADVTVAANSAFIVRRLA